MVPGFNHNIKHKGQVYHVQTEDSGVGKPHIITHLFAGGNILASKKTRYEELVGQDGLDKTVRSMMEEQHKQMLRNLINGVYDSVETGDVHHLDGPAPLNTTPGIHSPNTAMMGGDDGSQGGVDVRTSPNSVAPVAQERKPVVTTAPKGTSNIFGEDLISEKSLDEVILTYLAEDLAKMD